MSVARSLERRLERLLDAVAGKVFSGRLHPAELAGRLAREADFARFEHESGPATANRYVIQLNPRDLTVDTKQLEDNLTEELEGYAAEEGLRLEGPVTVTVEPSPDVAPGDVAAHVEVSPGKRAPWAKLVGDGTTFEIRHNRCLIGRSQDADVPIPADDVSRSHALIWRKEGAAWISDLGSANGTTADGQPVTDQPVRIASGSTVSLSSHTYRFMEQ